MEEEVSYKTLRKIQENEKNLPTLAQLKPEFYSTLNKYLENLNSRLEKEKTPQKQILINDEIQNTKKIASSIYEYREKKILLATISKARGGNPDLKNMIDAEKTLFESILNIMLESRRGFLEEEKSKEVEKIEEKEDILTEPKITDEVHEPERPQENPNIMVRITQDIPEFVGIDEKKYTLKKNDVISLPKEMSAMLTKRGAAEKINPVA